jgi:hypothetical protein
LKLHLQICNGNTQVKCEYCYCLMIFDRVISFELGKKLEMFSFHFCLDVCLRLELHQCRYFTRKYRSSWNQVIMQSFLTELFILNLEKIWNFKFSLLNFCKDVFIKLKLYVQIQHRNTQVKIKFAMVTYHDFDSFPS